MKKPIHILSTALIVLFLSACGKNPSSSSSEESNSAGSNGIERTVVITANDQIEYNITNFTVSAGETVELTLKHVGNMPKESMGHNVVIIQRGGEPVKFAKAAMKEASNDYIPPEKTNDIIANTKMLGGGEIDTIVFTAPRKKGDYPFLCTFPGHVQQGMRGTMVVN